MKSPFTSKLTKASAVFSAFLGTAVLFSACKNDMEYNGPEVAAMAVVNAYPNTNTLDFFVGGQKVNNTGLAFGQKLGYFQAYEGPKSIDVSYTGTATSLFNKSVNLKPSIYHSLYIVGSTPQTLDYLVIEDDPTAPPANKAKIRFINLSPDAGALNLELVGDTTKFEDRAYKAYTMFKPVDAKKTNFVLRDKSSNAIKASLDTVTLTTGKTYTIWAKGLNAGTDVTKLSIAVTSH